MACATRDLKGLRILVVEDNFLLAEVISDVLVRYGCRVVGPAGDVDTALKLAREAEFDGALLDIGLFGEFCFPVAEVLTGRRIPFLFLTGYSNLRVIPTEFRTVPRLSKPINPAGLSSAIAERFCVPMAP